ncbi:MAG TPA: hypothetical protein VGN59_13200 [Acidimicrobiia bacterium]
MEDRARGTRVDRGMDRLAALGRRTKRYASDLVRNPVRLLIGGICIVLIAVALPLLIGGGMRLHTAWSDWRHERTVGRDWVRSTATITEVREGDGLSLRLTYFDRAGERQGAQVEVEGSGGKWIDRRLPIRYDPQHPSQVDLVNIAEVRPVGSALVAGAAIGAGLAALTLALGLWRRRRVLRETSRPFTVMRVPLALAGSVLALGLAAWAVGTVSLRGWSGVADRLGKQFSVVFGDLLGVMFPLVTFAIGCLLTAWLARHRHHDDHDGMLSNVHRVIDRAAGYVPSPEDLQAEQPDSRTGCPALEPARERQQSPEPVPEPAGPQPTVPQADETIRTGR